MRTHSGSATTLVLLTAFVPACNLVLGYDELEPNAIDGASAAGGAHGSGAGSGASGGASGGASSGSGAAGGTPQCAGDWGSPETVLEDPNVDQIGSVSIALDELVVFYQARIDTSFDVRMSTRTATSEPFGVGVVVPELSAICADEVDGGGPGRSRTMSSGVIIQVRTLPKSGSIGGRGGVSMLLQGISPRASAPSASAIRGW